MNILQPLFLNLSRINCLVIGARTFALQKIMLLLEAQAKITVIATEASDEVIALYLDGKIDLIQRTYQKNDINNYSIVICAIGKKNEANKEIFEEAKERNILINIVDQPDISTFSFGATSHHPGNIKVCVSSNGKSPHVAQHIRDQISKELQNYELLINTIIPFREHVQEHIASFEERRDVLQVFFSKELLHQTRMRYGFLEGSVAIVGAGPGDPDLISVKSLHAIEVADAIFYDRLVNPELLLHAPSQAELIDVGKIHGVSCRNQQKTINASMSEYARQGKFVVRLKGGDPSIFGMLSAEIFALTEAKIPFKIIPGISAAFGAAASCCIPLTDRAYNSGVTIITGHMCQEHSGKAIDWNAAWNGTKTLVIYMGLKELPTISKNLISAGCPSDTPVAVIENATLPSQRILIDTLENIVLKASAIAENFVSPTLIMVGENVKFSQIKNV